MEIPLRAASRSLACQYRAFFASPLPVLLIPHLHLSVYHAYPAHLSGAAINGAGIIRWELQSRKMGSPDGYHSVAVGKGTRFVPAAHGPRRQKPTDPARVESPASQGQHANKKQESAARFDPFRVGKIHGSLTVGGGHKNRALAHGYSIFTPAGREDARHPELHTPVCSQKCGTCSGAG